MTPELQRSKPGLENGIRGAAGIQTQISVDPKSGDITCFVPVLQARSQGWQGQGRTDLQTMEPIARRSMERNVQKMVLH